MLIVANDVLRPSTISSLHSVRPPHTRSPNGGYAQQIPALLHRSQIVSVNQTTCPTPKSFSNLYPGRHLYRLVNAPRTLCLPSLANDTHLRHERWYTVPVHCLHGNVRQQLSMRRNAVSLLAHYTHSILVRGISINQSIAQSDSKDRYKSPMNPGEHSQNDV